MRPRLKRIRRQSRAAAGAPLGTNCAVHIATYGPHMPTQWALPSSEAPNSSTRSPPIGSAAWWCTTLLSLKPRRLRRGLVHAVAVLGPDLILDFLDIAKLPAA